MDSFSRRAILKYIALFPFFVLCPKGTYAQEIEENFENRYPQTISVLKDAYSSEMTAHKHYDGFCNKAKEEKFPNIAYLFAALSLSEKIHAENYLTILTAHNINYVIPEATIQIDETKINLKVASERELTKMNKTYPDFLDKLEKESFAEAILHCLWSWKCHRQHEKEIQKVFRYSESFFSTVAGEIESRSLDFHVCKVCGATISKAPDLSCEICNYPMTAYMKIPRPV